jgi:hypothetical protein
VTASPESFTAILTAAIRDLSENGFDDVARLHEWMRRLRMAAIRDLPTDDQLDNQMRSAMRAAFNRAISQTQIKRSHPGITRFTVERIKPELRLELDRRILASAELIKLNRARRIEETLQRFSGWATSIPAGGSRVVDKADTKADIAKGIKSFSFEARRVSIDQGHKLIAAVNDVLAMQTDAIAAIWRSHGRHDASYDARPEHLARDGKVFAIRNNWAIQRGLMNKGEGYTDEMERVGELPYCRCYMVYLHHLRELPDDMLTERGRFALAETKAKVA